MDVTHEDRMKAYLMGWAYRKGENMRKGLPDDGVTYQQMELAYYMGLATRKGEEMRLAEMAVDEALADSGHWITIHPNDGDGYRRIKIDGEGTILAGLSKAHVGRKISEIGEVFRKTKTGGKTETVTETKTETKTETETEAETETETETETEKETEPPIQHSQLFLDMKAQIENYQKTNPEVWGWLYIEAKYLNTSGVEVISYPLMLGTDNEYYLTHKWDRSYSKLGAIFADCRTDPDMLDNRNVVIYGHNMAAGTMLHKLLKVYKSKSVFMGTNGCYVDITIYTTEAIYKFDLFSMYVTSAYSDYRTVYFVGDTHWVDYLNARQKLSKWSKNYEFNENDMMITFSTCTDEIENGRMAFHCILTEILY